jgi:hypothetical protein
VIPLSQLLENGVYIIHARNSIIVIWRGKDKAFVIRRSKFRSTYACEEFHFDTGSPHGTVKPLRYLGIKMSHNLPNLDELYSLSEKHENEYDQLVRELNLTEE